jgi:hypothetical protein
MPDIERGIAVIPGARFQGLLGAPPLLESLVTSSVCDQV